VQQPWGQIQMKRDAQSCLQQAEFCRQAALHSPPELAAEFRRLAEAWTKLAEGLDPEADLSPIRKAS